MTTLAERWKAEGEAQGRVEGRRAGVVQLLNLKFGALPASALARIETATEAQLVHWTARVLTADSLAAVLSD